jgi:type IV pilus assembly protein PilM
MPLKKSGGPIVGLDIGSSFIKACEIDCRGGRAHLRGVAVAPTPPEAVSNSEITDPVTLGKTIKQILQQAGIKAKKVVTCVAGQSSLVVRIIEVPKMTRAELQETMKWEIERHVPFASEQVVMDYQPLVPPEEVPEGQNMEVLLAVAQEALVTRHVEAIQAAGLQPIAIDIEPLASSRSLLDLSNGEGPGGTVAIVDIGATTTDISIYRDGRISFTRSIQLAGNNLTKAISDVLGQPLADAERLKKDMAAIPDPGQPGGGGGGGGMLDANQLGALPELDFGQPAQDPLGGVLGGTFGSAPSPGASTATDTQAEPVIDIAGAGFSDDAFMSPAPGPGDTAPGEASSFGVPGAAAPGGSIFDTPGGTAVDPGLSGPVPGGNPFDSTPPGDTPPAQPAGAGTNPFEGSLFGPSPGADPFAPVEDLGSLLGGGGPTSGAGTPDYGAPAAMSDDDYIRTQIGDAIMPVLHELVTELRRSLDFYRNRANGLGAQQVMITGGTAKLPGLADFLTANLDTPVVVGNPLHYLSPGPKADPSYLEEVGPVFPVCVGLAVRELLVEPAPPRKKK